MGLFSCFSVRSYAGQDVADDRLASLGEMNVLNRLGGHMKPAGGLQASKATISLSDGHSLSGETLAVSLIPMRVIVSYLSRRKGALAQLADS
jgi:hypothetical protein